MSRTFGRSIPSAARVCSMRQYPCAPPEPENATRCGRAGKDSRRPAATSASVATSPVAWSTRRSISSRAGGSAALLRSMSTHTTRPAGCRLLARLRLGLGDDAAEQLLAAAGVALDVGEDRRVVGGVMEV